MKKMGDLNWGGDTESVAELFQATEKVDIKKAVDKLSDERKKGLPELTSDSSEWYDESEVEYHEDADVVDLARPLRDQVTYDDWMEHRKSGMRNAAPMWKEAMMIEQHKGAAHMFKRINKKQQDHIYQREIKRGEKLPRLKHPEIISTDTKELLDQWREYNGEYVGNSTVDFEELIPELDKRFTKLKFSWKYGNLQVSWRQGILEHSNVQVSKINMHALEDIAKSVGKITDDEKLIKDLLVNIIGRTLEEVF
tara:strand:- start:1774 stop:2529 length:756 start_codon:yes stop_codon:yes gene_type:complete